MNTRRDFLKKSTMLAVGSLAAPRIFAAPPVKDVGIQLYSVRKEMLQDAKGTLKELARIGYKQLESARSEKGNYYGLAPKEVKTIVQDLGMTMRSGHVHLDKDFQRSIDQAVEAGQEYLIVSSMPSNGQTIDNYKKVANAFTKAGEQCRKSNLKFGYHNHDYEFEKVNGQVLYDVLLDHTDPSNVYMEMDLGWVIVTGNDPLQYFDKYTNRFPLWHLKDMNIEKKHSTEFGKGGVDIYKLLANADKSGMKYFFVEQEEYANTALESVAYDYNYLMKQ